MYIVHIHPDKTLVYIIYTYMGQDLISHRLPSLGGNYRAYVKMDSPSTWVPEGWPGEELPPADLREYGQRHKSSLCFKPLNNPPISIAQQHNFISTESSLQVNGCRKESVLLHRVTQGLWLMGAPPSGTLLQSITARGGGKWESPAGPLHCFNVKVTHIQIYLIG